MPRSISTQLLLAVLLAAGLPFAGFVYFVVDVVERRITQENIEFYLQSKAGDLADKINLAIQERRRDLELWSTEPAAIAALRDPGEPVTIPQLKRTLDIFCKFKVVYRLLVVFDRSGRAVAWNPTDPQGSDHSPTIQKRLEGADAFHDHWFQAALRAEKSTVGWHLDPLNVEDVSQNTDKPSDYSFAFAAPIFDPDDKQVLGAFYCLVNWTSIQNEILDFGDHTQPGAPAYRSGYAFLWEAGDNRIIGHPNRKLYGTLVAEPPVSLPKLSIAVRDNPNGIVYYHYPENTEKRAAFRQTLTNSEGGFGWIVGVGVEDEEVFAPARIVRFVLTVGMVIGISGLLIWIFITSRAITKPLTELANEAERIAGGDLEARVSPSGPAETVALGRAFNHMAEEIARNREKLVRAEKEAAWREMARQISHEIKNPLTPMKLSISLLEKAWRDRSPEFETILQRSIATIDRQIESLRRIAADFRTFAGAPERKLEKVNLLKIVEEVASLYSAAASEKNVQIKRSGENTIINGDAEELRRAIVNLIDNAVQAAPDHTQVEVKIESEGRTARILVSDDGPGIPEALRSKLFTPYFSTKTHGTGLGLAIVRRIAEDHGGRAYLYDDPRDANSQSPRTTMIIELSAAERE
ncbi:MAG: ATP-binding protein [Planctomycetota bacterium]